jgi:lipopolysaccharide transport system permease protein
LEGKDVSDDHGRVFQTGRKDPRLILLFHRFRVVEEGIVTRAPSIVIEASKKRRGWPEELWSYRELLYFLIWRDIKVRYRQTALGAAWAVLQPLLTMIVFSIFFGRLAGVPSEGFPYPIFTYAALLPWQLFSHALTQSGNSIVTNQQLITKIYFPRLIIPISSVLSGIVDFFIAFLVLVGLMIYYGIYPTVAIFALPLLVLFTIAVAFSAGFWLSALNVHYRDVRYAIPFLTQIWMFATPIAYPSSLLSGPWRQLYGLNPMVGLVEGFRWAILGRSGEITSSVFISLCVVILLLIGGICYFQRMEKTFADIV